MTVYVVEALRGGSRERHSYVVGVYDTLDGAKTAADAEVEYRGGKYTCVVLGHRLNQTDAWSAENLYATEIA